MTSITPDNSTSQPTAPQIPKRDLQTSEEAARLNEISETFHRLLHDAMSSLNLVRGSQQIISQQFGDQLTDDFKEILELGLKKTNRLIDQIYTQREFNSYGYMPKASDKFILLLVILEDVRSWITQRGLNRLPIQFEYEEIVITRVRLNEIHAKVLTRAIEGLLTEVWHSHPTVPITIRFEPTSTDELQTEITINWTGSPDPVHRSDTLRTYMLVREQIVCQQGGRFEKQAEPYNTAGEEIDTVVKITFPFVVN